MSYGPRPLIAASTLAMATSMIPLFAVSALAPFLVADLDLTRAQIGGLVTACFAVAAVLSLAVGHVVDVIGARAGFLALALAVAVGLAGASAADSYATLLGALAVAGVGQALANPVTNVAIATGIPPTGRGVAVGVKQSGVQLGAFGIGLGAPLMAAAAGWQVTFRWLVLLPVVLVWAAWSAIPPRPSGIPRTPRLPMTMPPLRIRWLIGYSLLIGTALAAVNTYLPLYATERLDFGNWAGGALLAGFGVTGLLARVLWGRWSDRVAELMTLLSALSAFAVLAVFLVAAAEVWGPSTAWIGAIGLGASATAANAVSMVAVVRLGGRTGHATALVSLGFFAGFVVGPTTFGLTADSAGYAVAWLTVGGVLAVSGVVALVCATLAARERTAAVPVPVPGPAVQVR